MQYIWQLQDETYDYRPLYVQNGWTNYLRDWDKTRRAIQHSKTLSALSDHQVVGLIRAVTDGETILYIQDLLVLPEYQRRGIATHLLKQLLSKYPGVGQIVLIAEASKTAELFYAQMGFQTIPTDYGTALVLDRR
jgi:ribosomal protein S18 acetylase RimI-like enzyme